VLSEVRKRHRGVGAPPEVLGALAVGRFEAPALDEVVVGVAPAALRVAHHSACREQPCGHHARYQVPLEPPALKLSLSLRDIAALSQQDQPEVEHLPFKQRPAVVARGVERDP
jgi:hypothetical protein